jgi:hypothetical protein
MENSLREELLGVVQKFAGAHDRVSDETRLYHDLGISGDDAVELFNEVRRRFGTTFVDFSISSYFPSETEAMPELWFNYISRLFRHSGRRKTLSFGHLAEVVKSGHWFEPPSA